MTATEGRDNVQHYQVMGVEARCRSQDPCDLEHLADLRLSRSIGNNLDEDDGIRACLGAKRREYDTVLLEVRLRLHNDMRLREGPP